MRRNVDVLDTAGRIIHTYPIVLDRESETADEREFIAIARENIAADALVPDYEMDSITFLVRRT